MSELTLPSDFFWGVATSAYSYVADADRVDYLKSHIEAVASAVRDRAGRRRWASTCRSRWWTAQGSGGSAAPSTPL